jgi:hypothetical protein
VGGNIPSHDDVLKFVQDLARRYQPAAAQEEERMAHV